MTRPTTSRKRRAIAGLASVFTVLCAPMASAPAQAQFGWFGSNEASPQDVYDTIAEHGFRLVGPLYRNGRVYVADVLDRRARRERLVISAESGQIVQRFLVDLGGPERRAYAERVRPQPRDDSFFSHLSRGWDDEPPPRPPLSLPTQPDADTGQPTVIVPRAKPRPEPRVVTRTDVAPVTAAPLPPAPDKKSETAAKRPETPADSAATAPGSAPSGRATRVVNDPLRLPGTRKAEESRAAAAPTAVATVKPPEPSPPAKPAPAKPVPAKPADVPVAPLD